VTDVASWLAARRPAPPADLAAALDVAGEEDGSLVEVLASAGRARLDVARAHPGRVRQSAFRLLEADALLTYACEAALEAEEPITALQSVLDAAGG
jgi:hypothetical protein